MAEKETKEALRERLCADFSKSKKYRAISRETFLDVIDHELPRHADLKVVETVVKRKLHRVAAFYLGEPEYGAVTRRLNEAFSSGDDTQIRAVCSVVLQAHASTAERIPDLAALYETIFAVTGKPRVLLDLACAFNPFSWRWMGLDRSVAFHAFDINQRTVSLLQEYFRLEGLQPLVELRDVLTAMPQVQADVALLFKMYHCLEARRRGAGNEVIERVPAKEVVVTLPSKNLEGRARDLGSKYRQMIQELCSAKGWGLVERTVPSELCFIVQKG